MVPHKIGRKWHLETPTGTVTIPTERARIHYRAFFGRGGRGEFMYQFASLLADTPPEKHTDLIQGLANLLNEVE